MQTLDDLYAGRLVGAKRVKLACGLTAFPQELFTLADSLEVLDLSDNQLSCLPDDFSRFQKLRIFFASNNPFEVMPAVLGQCPELQMVGFKACRIQEVPAEALPPKLRWLILTDNCVEALPAALGDCVRLQKLMLAGNRLRELPSSMSRLVNLELLRLSANLLEGLPDWLLQLPKLSWLAFSGNPFSPAAPFKASVESVHWDELEVCHSLGEGASGVISLVRRGALGDMALKVFKGAITSDGLPEHEMAASLAAGVHDSLVPVLGTLDCHPEGRAGLLLALIDEVYGNLAGPPSLDSCTRDVYAEDRTFSVDEGLRILRSIASVAVHLHERGINHGDLYGHNILVTSDGEALLSDFGAASYYGGLGSFEAERLARIEVRAFGCLMEEILCRLVGDEAVTVVERLTSLMAACLCDDVDDRPGFAEIDRVFSLG